MLDAKLYTLLQVCECKSFSEAAKKLSLTQPAVSHHIKVLEEELGVRIFERRKGDIVVTHEGKAVVTCAKKLLGLYNSLRQDLSDSRDLLTHLTVGITHTAESNAVAEALARYCAVHSHVTIKMITDTLENLYRMLKNYEIDLAVVEGSIPSTSVKYLTLDQDCLMLAVSPNHPFASRKMISLQDLTKERMIIRLPNSGTRNLFDAHLESNNMSIRDFNVILELDNIATIKDLIRRDFGVSVLPKSVCLDELKKQKIVMLPVENLSMMRFINIAYLEDFSRIDMLHDIVSAYHDAIQNYQ